MFSGLANLMVSLLIAALWRFLVVSFRQKKSGIELVNPWSPALLACTKLETYTHSYKMALPLKSRVMRVLIGFRWPMLQLPFSVYIYVSDQIELVRPRAVLVVYISVFRRNLFLLVVLWFFWKISVIPLMYIDIQLLIIIKLNFNIHLESLKIILLFKNWYNIVFGVFIISSFYKISPNIYCKAYK